MINLEDMNGRHLQSIISKPIKTQERKWTSYISQVDKRDKRNISSALELSWERLTWWWKFTRWWSNKCCVRTKLMRHWEPVGDALPTREATGSLPRSAFVWDASLTRGVNLQYRIITKCCLWITKELSDWRHLDRILLCSLLSNFWHNSISKLFLLENKLYPCIIYLLYWEDCMKL